jgi:hypothetical protein
MWRAAVRGALLAMCAGAALAASFEPFLADVDALDLAVGPKGRVVLLAGEGKALVFNDAGGEQKLAPIVPADGFTPVRVAAHPKGGAWVAETKGRAVRVRLLGPVGNVVATSDPVEPPAAAPASAPALDRDGETLLLAVGPRVLAYPADLKAPKTLWEAPEHLHDLFATVDVASLPGGGFALLERFSCQVFVVDKAGKLAWRFGGRGNNQGQLGEASGMAALPRGDEAVIAVTHRFKDGPALSLFDRYGCFFNRIDGLKGDSVRADPEGQLLLHDRKEKSVLAAKKLEDMVVPAPGAPADLYAGWTAAARTGDKTAAEKLVLPWSKAEGVSSPMRAAVFRICAYLGFDGAADAEIERAIVEMPARADLIAEAMEHAVATRRIARASALLEKYDWCIQDDGEREQLAMLLLGLRERAIAAGPR